MRIAITAGEPAGIGPELCARLATLQHDVELVFVCDPDHLGRAAATLGHEISIRHFDPAAPAAPGAPGTATVLPVPLAHPCHWGQLDQGNAGQVLACLEAATQGCINGTFQALVTAPLHKGIINDSGVPFTGHTEFLAAATDADHVVMLLVANQLRVALATTHLPLSKVSQAINAEFLRKTLSTLDQGLRDRFGIDKPRIVVCGLNPHAGEGGHLGVEDRDIIEPLLGAMRSEGMQVSGPLPADTAFTPRHLEHADAVLAMYHDQGLPVLKYAGFGTAVNVTLGLPIIRTSVDHGTALDLAGQGAANHGSMAAALSMALDMAIKSEAHRPRTTAGAQT